MKTRKKHFKRVISLLMSVIMIMQFNFVSFAAETKRMINPVDYPASIQATGFEAAKRYLIDQLLTGATEIDVSQYKIPATDFVHDDGVIGDTYQTFLMQNSVLFHLEKYQSPTIEKEGGYAVKLYPKYTIAEPGLSETLKKYNAELERALSVVTPGMNNLEKALAIHDYMALNYVYLNTTSEGQPEAQMNKLVLEKTGNCFAYTRTYEYLMNTLGVRCARVTSNRLNHIWNIIQMDDGNWYHVDVTWDDPVPDVTGFVQHRYFLLSDEEILKREHACSDMSKTYAATSKKYDTNAPWEKVTSQVIQDNGMWYYVEPSYKSNDQITEDKIADGAIMQYNPKTPDIAPTVYHEMKASWPVWGSPAYYTTIFSGIGKYNGKLYYQSTDKIYTIDLPSAPLAKSTAQKKATPVYSQDISTGYYYGMYIENSTLNYTIGTQISKTQGKLVIDLEKNEFQVKYNATGGNPTPEAQIKVLGTPLKITEEVPTRDEFIFQGWALKDGGEVVIQPGEEYIYEQDVTFYAVWKQNRTVVDGLHYVINDGKATLVDRDTDYNKANVVIPSEITIEGVSYPVTAIGREAFKSRGTDYNTLWNRWLKTIVIPEGVEYIGEGAFENCLGLTSVTFPTTLHTVDSNAFVQTNNIKDFKLPPNLKKTGSSAFYGCSSNKVIDIPASLTDVGEYTFARMKKVEVFNVDPNNPAICSKDGVLFSKDMKTLIQYPINNPRTTYFIPDTVDMIYCTSFAWNIFYDEQKKNIKLRHVYAPGKPIQAMGYTFDDARDGFTIYGRQDTRLRDQILGHKIAFREIKFVDVNEDLSNAPKQVDRIEISGVDRVAVSTNIQLFAKTYPEDVIDDGVIWRSSDETKATVDQFGRVSGKSEGPVTITAVARDRGDSGTEKPTIAEHVITVTPEPSPEVKDKYDVDFARSIIESLDYTVAQENGNTVEAIKLLAEEQLKSLNINDVQVEVVIESDTFAPAMAGVLATPNGTDGKYDITFNLTKNSAKGTASKVDNKIKAMFYVAQVEIDLTASNYSAVQGEQITLTTEVKDIHEPEFEWYQWRSGPTDAFHKQIGKTGSNHTFNLDTSEYTIPTGEQSGTFKFYCKVNGKKSNLISIEIRRAFQPVAEFSRLPSDALTNVSLQLEGTVLPDDATNRDIFWRISDINRLEGVTLVNNIFVATKPGIATLEAIVINGLGTANYVKIFQVHVVNREDYIPVTGISNMLTEITAKDWFTLPTEVLPDNASKKEIIWSAPSRSENTSQVLGLKIEDGKIWAEYTSADNYDKNAIIVATVIDGLEPGVDFFKEYSIPIYDEYLEVDDIIGVPNYMITGDILTLSGNITPINANVHDSQKIEWSISPENKLNGLSLNGKKLTATTGGTAIIRATIPDGLGKGKSFIKDYNITVQQKYEPVTSITMLESNREVVIHDTLKLIAEIMPKNATNQEVTWSIAEDNTLQGAQITEDQFTSSEAGTARVTAKIIDEKPYTLLDGIGSHYAGQKVVSETFDILVKSPTVITKQPEAKEVEVNTEVELSIEATGFPSPTYQWQREVDGEWKDIENATSATYVFTATKELNNSMYRCIAANSATTVQSNAVKLTVFFAPDIQQQPVDAYADLGATASFSVVATGNPEITYQWQEKNGDSWTDMVGETNSTLSLVTTSEDYNKSFRCRLNNRFGTIDSNEVRVIKRYAVSIMEQPKNTIVLVNDTAIFSIRADGSPDPTYQWQTKVSNTWSNIEGATSETYTISKVTEEMDHTQYRCVVKNSVNTIVSAVSTLSVGVAAEITQEPKDISIDEQEKALFTIEANGYPKVSYQWQEEVDGQFVNIKGAKGKTLSIKANKSNNGKKVRCVVSNRVGENDFQVVSRTAVLTVMCKPVIILQPKQMMAGIFMESMYATVFTILTDGEDSYQWQKMVDGANWEDITYAGTFATVSIVDADGYKEGDKIRCKVVRDKWTIYSDVVEFVIPKELVKPTAIIGMPTEGAVDVPLELTATVEPENATYQNVVYEVSKNNKLDGVTIESGNILVATKPGVAELKAKVYNGNDQMDFGNQYFEVLFQVNIKEYSKPIIVEEIPTQQEVETNEMLQLNAVIAGGKEVTYQWQKGIGSAWEDMSDEISPSLSFVPTLKDNGARFRCAITYLSEEAFVPASRSASYAAEAGKETMYTEPVTIKVISDGTEPPEGNHDVITDINNTSTIDIMGQMIIEESTEMVYSITVNWESTNFVYNETVSTDSVWNPVTHSYEGGTITGEWIGEGKVKVSNHSNDKVDIFLNVEYAEGVSGVTDTIKVGDEVSNTFVLPTAVGTPVDNPPSNIFTFSLAGEPKGMGREKNIATAVITVKQKADAQP